MNSLTVDGIALNDGFGLNDNGYPANRMPFSYDAIKQVSAEFAPFDVQYGGFSACVVNAITKSGSNEFKGNFFYEFTNDDLLSDKVDGNKINNTAFDEDKYGFNLVQIDHWNSRLHHFDQFCFWTSKDFGWFTPSQVFGHKESKLFCKLSIEFIICCLGTQCFFDA